MSVRFFVCALTLYSLLGIFISPPSSGKKKSQPMAIWVAFRFGNGEIYVHFVPLFCEWSKQYLHNLNFGARKMIAFLHRGQYIGKISPHFTFTCYWNKIANVHSTNLKCTHTHEHRSSSVRNSNCGFSVFEHKQMAQDFASKSGKMWSLNLLNEYSVCWDVVFCCNDDLFRLCIIPANGTICNKLCKVAHNP